MAVKCENTLYTFYWLEQVRPKVWINVAIWLYCRKKKQKSDTVRRSFWSNYPIGNSLASWHLTRWRALKWNWIDTFPSVRNHQSTTLGHVGLLTDNTPDRGITRIQYFGGGISFLCHWGGPSVTFVVKLTVQKVEIFIAILFNNKPWCQSAIYSVLKEILS